MGDAGQAPGARGRSVGHRVRHRGEHPHDQVVTQGGQPLRLDRLLGDRRRRRGREGGHPGGVEGTRADVAFLPAAVGQRRQRQAPAYQQRAHADRATELVRADRERVRAAVLEGHRDRPDGLDGVGVEHDPVTVRDRRELRDRRDGADLVVRPHHADQGDAVGITRDRRGEDVGAHHPGGVHGQQLDLGVLRLGEPDHGVEDGPVLDGADEHPVPARLGGTAGPVQPLDGQVVAFGAAGGEDHLGRTGTQCGSERFTRLFDYSTRTTAAGVQRRRVPAVRERRGVGGHGLRTHRRGRRMVEVGHITEDIRAPPRYPADAQESENRRTSPPEHPAARACADHGRSKRSITRPATATRPQGEAPASTGFRPPTIIDLVGYIAGNHDEPTRRQLLLEFLEGWKWAPEAVRPSLVRARARTDRRRTAGRAARRHRGARLRATGTSRPRLGGGQDPGPLLDFPTTPRRPAHGHLSILRPPSGGGASSSRPRTSNGYELTTARP